MPPEPVRVVIPYEPRPWQREVGQLARARRFGVIVCHRRAGKTHLAANLLQQTALMCERPRPRTAYIAPTYSQGKATAWDILQHYARPIPSVQVNQSELRIDYPNAGQSRIYGGDNPDALRGLYLDRAVLDEYGLHATDIWSTVVTPMLVDRGGSAILMGTPNGRNQFHQIAQHAKAREAAGDANWFYREFKASQTGLLDADYLREARAVMTEDEYQQEFECSFEAAVKGAIYAKELATARAEARVGLVSYDPALPVDTDWDLGVGDGTAIWFSQSLRGGDVRAIDYYEASGEGLPHYAKVLAERGYVYGTHWAPHDIEVRELASGRSRLEAARSLGINFRIAPKVSVEDGIHAARLLFPRCWFSATRCAAGLEALQHYRRDYNTRLAEFKATPVHDWASHGADAFRYLAVRQRAPQPKPAAEAPYRPVGVWS